MESFPGDGKKRLRTRLLEALGAVLLALGFVGIFLPVLPTTPFVLAAAFCFASNPVMYAKIRDSPYFGEYFRAYREGGTVSRRTRAKAVAMVWIVMAVSIVLLDITWLRLLLLVICAVVTLHLLTIGRGKKER